MKQKTDGFEVPEIIEGYNWLPILLRCFLQIETLLFFFVVTNKIPKIKFESRSIQSHFKLPAHVQITQRSVYNFFQQATCPVGDPL